MKRPAALVIALALPTLAPAQLPPPPVPVENPVTEEKRVLGKILFWDEQLSSDDTIACGTCHLPASGGADPRIAVHPGPDGIPGTPDDILGSPGVVRSDAAGTPTPDPIFGFEVQITSRAANSAIGAAYAPELFHDGRASSVFVDPESGAMSIVTGGGLESQAVGPILSDVEMARENRTWDEVRTKLGRVLPLDGASDLPPDVAAALSGNPGYPQLFQTAFGDPAITAERIGFAIATYERTLVADQTPWDAFIAGDTAALTPNQQQGWNDFQAIDCNACHAPPEFTDHSFRNIGIRPPEEDLGRQNVTGLIADRGKFKTPTLRNVGLKATFMHNGRLPDVLQSVSWYRGNNPQRFADNLDPLLPLNNNPQRDQRITDFLVNGLTDPRVAAEQFPFDRPVLHAGAMQVLEFADGSNTLSWPALAGIQSYNVYRGDLAALIDDDDDGLPDAEYGSCVSGLDPNDTDTIFDDDTIPGSGAGFFYLKTAVDGQDSERGLGATSDGLPRQPAVGCP